MPFRSLCLFVAVSYGATAVVGAGGDALSQYLSDTPERLVSSTQGWGELGIDAAAHAPGTPGQPLQIAGQSFSKGLGHHAPGSLVFVLDGEYAAFHSQVGLQPCPGGTMVFRVFVDGQLRFDSGLMRETNSARAVSVDLAGGNELRLEASDGGDGITCDMANWAEARLTRSSSQKTSTTERPRVDVASFARVVSFDPNRTNGATASRIEEYRAEDVFLEKEIKTAQDGNYSPPVTADGLACIGLQWLNSRNLNEVQIEFGDPQRMPSAPSIRLEGWFGESAWQGSWKSLKGEQDVTGTCVTYRLSMVQTRKVRWVFPAKVPVSIRRLSAFTRTRWAPAHLVVHGEGRGRGVLSLHNGQFLSDPETEKPIEFNLGERLDLSVLASTPSALNSDPTILQFQVGDSRFAVSVQDVLSNRWVYVPSWGVLVAEASAAVTLDDCRRQVSKTILQQVRELPEQSLDQAMRKTHHETQREGPVMLSLACDNRKFVAERDGAVRFLGGTDVSVGWSEGAGEVRPRFSPGTVSFRSRALEGGWLPIPVTTFEGAGVVYRERVFVVPVQVSASTSRTAPPVCVVEFVLTNVTAQPAEANLTLDVLAHARNKTAAKLNRDTGQFHVGDTAISFLVCEPSQMQLVLQDGQASWKGTLAAGGSARACLYLSSDPDMDLAALRKLDSKELRQDTERYWKSILNPATQVVTPDPWLNDLIRSSQVRCLIAARNEAGGDRVAAWIAAMSYGPLESEAHSVIRGMDFLGHSQFAQRSLDYFIHRYNTNGFLTTGYTTFGTAWHLWTLGEHFGLSADKEWLNRVTPEIIRVGHWIVRQLEKTKSEGQSRPEYGLMPPGVLADWNAYAYHFAMNGYYYAALTELSRVLAGSTSEAVVSSANFFAQKADSLRACIIRAYRWTQSQAPVVPLRNGTWVPYYPSQVHSPGKLGEFFPGQDAGRSWCYDVELGAHQLVPAGVFRADDPQVDAMLDHMEDRQFLADGWFDYPASSNEKDWFNLGGFSKVQPYYTRNCEVYALRDDIAPFLRSYFNSIASLVNPEVLTFWEHFHHSGAWDKTHETGYFLHQTRTMLLAERGEELWLAPLVTTNWLADGMSLSVSNAPTRFGPVSYTIDSEVATGVIRTAIASPTRTPPRRMVLRLRHPAAKPINEVLLNGTKHSEFDRIRGLIYVEPKSSGLTIHAKY